MSTHPPVRMPDGAPFPFWDDQTHYSHVYHVAQGHTGAADSNPGTVELPFATIGKAAEVVQPGEKVVIHAGVYREWVRPAFEGTGPEGMIAYEAAPGEEVHLRGSRVWAAEFMPSSGWQGAEKGKAWMGELPREWFIGYNPFAVPNLPRSEYTLDTTAWPREMMTAMELRRGMLYADGRPLQQVFFAHELATTDGAFWVEEPGLRLHFRLWNDADPRGVTLEVTAQEQVFAPTARYLGYIRLSGLHIAHAADGLPVPQRAMVSASRGHHWIIEDCQLTGANAIGIDVGNESWHATRPAELPTGGHILRRNSVRQCGICGIAGVGNVAGSLLEDNVVEEIGGHPWESFWETGGIKLHTCDTVLIRRNVIRHTRHAPGLWLDYLNRNCRVTENVFTDVESRLGGIYLEVSHAPNAIDHNLLWDIRILPDPLSGKYGGKGINVDTGEESIVVHNLIGHVRNDYAIGLTLNQEGREVGGRAGLCHRHQVFNNLILDCPQRVYFARQADNRCDGNLYATADDRMSFCVANPTPATVVNLAAWQQYFDFDTHGSQAPITATFNPQTLVVTLQVDGDLPAGVPDPEFLDTASSAPGPFPLVAGERKEYRLGCRK